MATFPVTLPKTLTANTPENVNDLNSNLTRLTDAINTVDPDVVGFNTDGVKREGYVSVSATETTVSAAYTLLATPDRVSGVVLPSNGWLIVRYQATWKESDISTAKAAIFLNGNQLQAVALPSPVVAETNTSPIVTADKFAVLMTSINSSKGLISTSPSVDYTGNVTTGQILALGAAEIAAAAGTYDVSIRFKTSAGTVTVKNRQLWVSTIGFT